MSQAVIPSETLRSTGLQVVRWIKRAKMAFQRPDAMQAKLFEVSLFLPQTLSEYQ